jgi:chromosomal replication initiation ATPase DnaA
MNEKQRLTYNIITSQNGDNADPVYMIVCGTAGTGKTYLISATLSVLLQQLAGLQPLVLMVKHYILLLKFLSVNIGICRVTHYSGYS